jgi:uncharacterized membrane protein YqiK
VPVLQEAEMTTERSPRVTIARRVAEILSDAAYAQAEELRRLAEGCMSSQWEHRALLEAEAVELDEAIATLDAALARSP